LTSSVKRLAEREVPRLRWRIRKCPKCGRYTLKDFCPTCGERTMVAHPHRFSPEDRYVKYRVLAKYPWLFEKNRGK